MTSRPSETAYLTALSWFEAGSRWSSPRRSGEWTGSKKRSDLDGQAGFLDNFGDGANVVLVRAGGAVRRDLHFVGDDFARQRGDVFDRSGTRSGKPEVERVNAERLHKVQNFDLLLDRRIADGRRLQAVAQRFIGQEHRPRRMQRLRIQKIPVVDQFRMFTGSAGTPPA